MSKQMKPSEVVDLKAKAESMTHWRYNELSGLSYAPSDPELGKAILALIAENEAKDAEIKRVKRILFRMMDEIPSPYSSTPEGLRASLSAKDAEIERLRAWAEAENDKRKRGILNMTDEELQRIDTLRAQALTRKDGE